MKNQSHSLPISSLLLVALLISFAATGCSTAKNDPLPSWNDGPNKQAIVDFVERTTKTDGASYLPVEDRIAVFDNDGTLWSEHPLYFQLAFAIDRIKALAPKHPEWRTKQPFKAVLENDKEALLNSGEHGLVKLLMASHAGMTTTEFEQTVQDWVSTAKHPATNHLYTEMVYQPMLELLDYLRSAEYKTFIVSGGGIEFMRPWTQQVYGIPPEQVVGSSIKTKFEVRNGTPVIVKLPEIDFIDDKEGKPVGIHKFIGKRPVAAFGNSDGDLAMLQWVSRGEGVEKDKTLALIVHHTDGDREWAYDRESHIGTLDKALDEAQSSKWIVADMKKDWKTIYPFEGK